MQDQLQTSENVLDLPHKSKRAFDFCLARLATLLGSMDMGVGPDFESALPTRVSRVRQYLGAGLTTI